MNIGVPAEAGPLTSKRDLLLQLADRCEREEPGEVLDGEIAEAIHGHHLWPWLPYTTSLDAAVTLVPEGNRWILTGPGQDDEGRAMGRVCTLENSSQMHGCWSPHPALALCAAALRARAAALSDEVGEQVLASSRAGTTPTLTPGISHPQTPFIGEKE